MRCRTVLADMAEGSSIAVNGACLTAVAVCAGSFSADVAPETLERSNLGDLRVGSLANLERPLSATGRLDGHLVQGHVDGTGELLGLDPLGNDNWWLTLRIPPELERYVVAKGSIALDGISLTVAEIDAGVLAVTIIPFTYHSTALHTRRPGDRLNVECDILAKYVEKFLGALRPEHPQLTMERLQEMGY
jgi:riboflavin synthase